MRTVQFFEVLARVDGQLVPFDTQLDWPELMQHYGTLPFEKRKVSGERDIFAAPHLHKSQNHLLIHKIKSGEDWMHHVDMITGDVAELETSAREGYVDTSVVCFLDSGNVIGLMEGSPSAPSHRTLEFWLNMTNAHKNTIVIEPIISPGEIQRLSQGVAVQRLELKVSDRNQLQGAHGSLAQVFRNTLDLYEPAVVTLTVSMPRGKPKPAEQDQREKLLSDVLALGDVMTGVDRAQVGLLFGEGDGYGAAQMAEMVEHRMTAKRKVAAVDEEGNSLRIEGAISVIMEELEAQRDELLLHIRGTG